MYEVQFEILDIKFSAKMENILDGSQEALLFSLQISPWRILNITPCMGNVDTYK